MTGCLRELSVRALDRLDEHELEVGGGGADDHVPGLLHCQPAVTTGLHDSFDVSDVVDVTTPEAIAVAVVAP